MNLSHINFHNYPACKIRVFKELILPLIKEPILKIFEIIQTKTGKIIKSYLLISNKELMIIHLWILKKYQNNSRINYLKINRNPKILIL